MGPCPCDLEATFLIAIDEYIGQAIVDDEIQERFIWRSAVPAIALTVLHHKAPCLCLCLKLAVVVGSASATILDATLIVVVMDHFVKERGYHFLNGAAQRSSADYLLFSFFCYLLYCRVATASADYRRGYFWCRGLCGPLS